MAEKSQVNWNEQPLEQPTPPPPVHTASCSLDTTPPIYKGQDSGVQPETLVEQAFKLEDWMTSEDLEFNVEALKHIATTEHIATTDGSDAMGVLKAMRDYTPPEVLKAAANLLPKPVQFRVPVGNCQSSAKT